MRIRLMGTLAECNIARAALASSPVLDVLDVDDPRPDVDGEPVAVDVEIRLRSYEAWRRRLPAADDSGRCAHVSEGCRHRCDLPAGHGGGHRCGTDGPEGIAQ